MITSLSYFKFGVMLKVFFLVLMFAVFNPIWAKPMPSLQVDLQWVNAPLVNQVSEIDITIVSHLATKQLQVNIVLPAGVHLTEGEAQRVIEVEKSKVKVLRLPVMVDEKASGEINVKVSIGSEKQAYFTATASLPVNEPGANQLLKSRSQVEPKYQRTEREGVKLREYQIR